MVLLFMLIGMTKTNENTVYDHCKLMTLGKSEAYPRRYYYDTMIDGACRSVVCG